MEIKENFNLALLTTFRIGGPARFFVEANSLEEIKEALKFAKIQRPDLKSFKGLALRALPVFILGGGSNVLISDNGFPGLILKISLKGKRIISEDEENVVIEISAGEVLDEVVGWTVENGWWGMENLSLVPGTLGGAIYINAGCYGQEIAGVIKSVRVFDSHINEIKTFLKNECGFGYRHSRFNTDDKGRFIILDTEISLSKTGSPNLEYGDLERWFSGMGKPTQKEIRDALITIRTNKGQDPDKTWSAGSFFSNFKLTKDEFDNLLEKIGRDFSEEKANELRELVEKIKAPSDGDKIKVPAAFILDKLLGLKGFKIGGAMHSPVQVLNLVNTGDASSGDLVALYENARQLVLEKTGLILVSEPEFVGFE